MSKFLNILAPALGGTAVVLGGAWYAAFHLFAPQPPGPLTATILSDVAAPETAPPVVLASSMQAAKSPTTAADGARFGLGRPATEDEVAAWNLDVSPDGTGLPEGSGDVLTGEALFSDNCAACHGEFAEGVDNWPKLAGGEGTLDRKDPVKTVGSYWPYLSTTWDYVHRSMPFGNAQSLEPDEVYAIVAYILYSNDLVDEDFVLSRDNFLDVAMPNADGFIVDDRETAEAGFWTGEPCMENCKDSVEITMRARVLDVTPQAEGAAEEMPAATVETAVTETATPEAGEAAAGTATDASAVDPALVAEGETVFKKCKACHQVGEGAENKTGPMLTGIVGRPAGSVEGFKYSKPLQSAGENGLVWDEDTLAEFLANPKAHVKGTKMSFAGLKKDSDLAAIIAYLRAFPGN
ncbi:MAG: MFS transporter [Rhodobacteraceae bacterium]|nr:MFS transporter [Paracoccaceae bacterium]